MEALREIIRPALRDRSTRFVFPSEVCAEAWLAEALGMGVGAIEADRFLGWDKLKKAAACPDGRIPVDEYMPRIFAASLLAENAAAPFLESIVPPAYADLWQPFAGYLASRLAALGRLPEAIRQAGLAGGAGSPAAADWLEVRGRYEAFLRAIGRFEPSYEPRSLRALGGTTIIFFPELIADFEEYRAALAADPGTRLAPLPRERPEARLRRPETALAEIRETLSEAGRLLDAGLEAERIAITVAGLEAYRPYLEREARLLSVPLVVRSGSSLAATAGGRVFSALRSAQSSGFAYDAMRDLLMTPAWPWKDARFGPRLLAEGRRLHAVAPWPEGGKRADAWERSLHGELLSSYRALKRKASDIACAADFRSLMKAYNAFRTEFLSPDREEWSEEANLSLARCVVELGHLARAQEQSGLPIKDAFGLFMRVLEATPYVGSSGDAGIPVYEWRVAAGISPERHFILGASQDGLAVPGRGFDYLGEALREEFSEAMYHDPRAAQADSAPSFIAAYALSGADVSFSCPRTGFAGELAAHGFLSAMSREDGSEARNDCAYRDEAAWLSGRAGAPRRLHAVQALGIAAAAEALPAEAEGASLGPEAAALASRRLYRRGESRASLDSTAVDGYLSCPYAYLYLRLLRAAPEASGIDFVDAIFIGEVYHEALALIFERIREEDGAFRPERAGDYSAMVGDRLGEAFEKLARKRGAFVGVALEAYRGRLEPCLQNLLAREAERFPSLEVGPVEADFELEYPLADFPEAPGGVVLRGRVDRVSRSEAGAVIVDYKKGRLPSRAQVAPDGSGSIAEAQIPCYLRLIGGDIDSAWYVSVEGDGKRGPGSAACAFASSPALAASRGEKSPYVAGDGLGPLLQAFDRALGDCVRGIFSGAFPLAPKAAQSWTCVDCGARGICRERYALRFGATA